jgi:hypothetical protein
LAPDTYNNNASVAVSSKHYENTWRWATRGVVNFYSVGAVTYVCRIGSRVTRLGEFLPTYWAIIFFGQFFENYRRSPNLRAIFFRGKIN